jgi:hypothetical protein
VRHPVWCDPLRCSAGSEDGAHVSVPVDTSVGRLAVVSVAVSLVLADGVAAGPDALVECVDDPDLRHRFRLDRRRVGQLRVTLSRALALRLPGPVCLDLGTGTQVQTFPLARRQAAALYCALGWALVMLSPQVQ